MFRAPRDLEWARRFYGQVPFDLASSGIPQVAHSDLGGVERLDDPSGGKELRTAIARFNGVDETDVVAALGASHALWLAYASLLTPGDDILVEEPAYEPLLTLAEGLGARIRRFARLAEERFRLDPGRIARAMTDKTRVVVVTNLHNPSGSRASADELREAARVAGARGASLLVDEVYAPFDDLCDADGVWGATARRLGGNVVTAASLTKGFGLGHQRIGWVLASPDVIRRAEATILATCGRLPLEHANVGRTAFARLPELAARARRLVGQKREVVSTWVASRHGIAWSGPAAGLFGFVTRASSEDLTSRIETAAHGAHVLVAPGSFFGVPNGFRLSWSIAPEHLAEGLSRVERLILCD